MYFVGSIVQENFYSYNGVIYIDNLKNPDYNLNNKKIAICISGQIRDGYEECFTLYNTFIINPLNADVFCCFEDCDITKKEFVNKILKPTKINYVTDYVKDINNSISVGTLSMYNKIYLANEFKKQYEIENNFIYDIVIRIRADLIIKEYLPKYILEKNLNKLYLPIISPKLALWGHPDFMAIGNSKQLNIYSDIFIYLITDLNNKCNISETLLLRYLNLNNIESEIFSYPIQLYRFKYDNISNILESIKYMGLLSNRYIFNNNC
jgi:hypothetical protein